MKKQSVVMAFDLGASSGRAILGQLNPDTRCLTIEEIHRFTNDPVQVGDHLYWDILRLFHEIKKGIWIAKQQGYQTLESIGIDSWAVDFGLLSSTGELLGNPYHYRDNQTDDIMEEVAALIGRERIFELTGLQFLQFNTIYQLYAMKKRNSPHLAQADKLLMIPELLRYFLTGKMYSEYTIATASQLFNPRTQDWEEELLQAIGVSEKLLLSPLPSGSKAGLLTSSICEEIGVNPITVIAVGEHDTASAVVTVPSLTREFAYLSCGTWSLMGTELTEPVMNVQTLEWNFTNEGGVYGTYRCLKNIMGLWLLQECKRIWDKEGNKITFEELVKLAEEAQPFCTFIDPDDPMFLNPSHMPKQIQQYCLDTKQYIPMTEGEIVRCILESLAFKYRVVLKRTEQLSGRCFPGLHMVGGGINNRLLCQFTANAIGLPVWCGPVEASAIGNLIVQYITLGYISDIWEGRNIIRKSFPIEIYKPQECDIWVKAFESFCQVIDD